MLKNVPYLLGQCESVLLDINGSAKKKKLEV